MTQFLTMTSLCGHPTFCIPAGRQKDGHFLSWTRVNIQGKRTFACSPIDICVQKAISRLMKERKKRKIMQIFLTKFQFPCAKKNRILKILKKFAFLRTCVLSQGISEATHVLTFFVFAFAMQICFFFLAIKVH